MDIQERKDLQGANLRGANLQGADLIEANLQGANLQRADLKGSNLQGSNLYKAKNLSFDQLSKVKNLYDAKLDEELFTPLKEKYPALFEKDD
jgi:uncharacterized protein YjbI with pentapeptide repeats